jgi:CO/xanthine dehydrogenase Mo-binding subunit
MGQGVSSALCLIAAEVLGVDTRRVKFLAPHTGRVPDSGPTVASRSTLTGGQAAKRAAEAVRAVLFEEAAEVLEALPETLVAGEGAIFPTGHPARRISFEEAVRLAYAHGRPLLGFGWFRAPHTSWDGEDGTGTAYFTFVYSANVAEVEVDMETGKVEVLRVTAAHDVGCAISPSMIRSQVSGGIAMGMGLATLERFAYARGEPVSRNLDEYLIPTALDAPEVDLVLVENPDPIGPFGAKSVGEPATEITAPAILNAIAHATGRMITRLPADLETVLLGRPCTREDAP